ncbi:uncharacterized protein [Macaca fascicularis]|uniref:uncharacterized protein n=1 Tax=Macaca fascicularis TaxID=9541 RepID=UPI003D15D47A
MRKDKKERNCDELVRKISGEGGPAAWCSPHTPGSGVGGGGGRGAGRSPGGASGEAERAAPGPQSPRKSLACALQPQAAAPPPPRPGLFLRSSGSRPRTASGLGLRSPGGPRGAAGTGAVGAAGGPQRALGLGRSFSSARRSRGHCWPRLREREPGEELGRRRLEPESGERASGVGSEEGGRQGGWEGGEKINRRERNRAEQADGRAGEPAAAAAGGERALRQPAPQPRARATCRQQAASALGKRYHGEAVPWGSRRKARCAPPPEGGSASSAPAPPPSACPRSPAAARALRPSGA